MTKTEVSHPVFARFYAHISQTVERGVLDAAIWPCLFGGCHTGRDTARPEV